MMIHRTLAVVLASTLWVLPSSGSAFTLSCADPPPDQLSFEEMIDTGTTGNDDYPVMFLGMVAWVRDVSGGPGGDTFARFAVAEHPVGYAPLVSDLLFYRDPPHMSSGRFDFRRDGRYVVIALRRPDGSFAFDGDCGQTRRLNRERFRALVRYARQH